jgi:hypothetical protein
MRALIDGGDLRDLRPAVAENRVVPGFPALFTAAVHAPAS